MEHSSALDEVSLGAAERPGTRTGMSARAHAFFTAGLQRGAASRSLRLRLRGQGTMQQGVLRYGSSEKHDLGTPV